jgi:hypothetical protein
MELKLKYVVVVFSHEEFLKSRAHSVSHVFPGFVARHQESELLLNVVVVGISVCFHAAEEIVLNRQIVCQTIRDCTQEARKERHKNQVFYGLYIIR